MITMSKDALWPSMRLDTGAGEKVRFHGIGGYPHDNKTAHERLRVGEDYTVRSVDVGNWVSYVYLEETTGSFNTVMFCNLEDAPKTQDTEKLRHD